MNKEELFYPEALDWMWTYCLYLGPYTDEHGSNYDLGVFLDGSFGRASFAIVYGNEDGQYISGSIDRRTLIDLQTSPDFDMYEETASRAIKAGLIDELGNLR